MSLKTFLKACVSALPLMAAGCGEAPTVIQNYTKGEDIVWSMVQTASRKGPMLVEVAGNPFGGGDEQLNKIILGTMKGAIQKRVITYTLDKTKASEPSFKITLLFGAPTTLNGNRICEGEWPEPQYNMEKITLRAVFCSRDELLSDVEGFVQNVTSAEDAKFKLLIENVLRELILLTP